MIIISPDRHVLHDWPRHSLFSLRHYVPPCIAKHIITVDQVIHVHGIQPSPNGSGWQNSLHRGSPLHLFFVFLGFRNVCLLPRL
jgi:hypothetical protein